MPVGRRRSWFLVLVEQTFLNQHRLLIHGRPVEELDHVEFDGELVADRSEQSSRAVDGGAFDQMSLECVGVFRSEKGAPTANAVCEYLDNDGDKLLGYAERTGVAGGKWRFVSGTGKYTGITGGGEYKYLGRFPRIREGHVQGCNRATGSYELKK